MSHPDDGVFISPKGPVPNVTVHAHMRSGPHSIMEYPLDLAVVIEVMFLFGEQARQKPGGPLVQVTPKALLERLKVMGVRSGNGSGRVGRDALYASFGRLREKGYLRRSTSKDDRGQVLGVSYEFYEFPAWNPDAPIISETVSSQVSPTSGNAGSGDAGKTSSSQVRSTSGNAGYGKAGSRTSPQVGSTSGNAGTPPHPPGGGGNHLPLPPQTGRGLDRAAAPREEGADAAARFNPERLQEAVKFLQELPKPFTVGWRVASRLAPLLLEAVEATGWELGDELAAELTKNPDGVRSGARVLEKERIPGLVLRSMVRRPLAGSAAGHLVGRPEADAECDRGCDSGWIETPDGMKPCACRSPRHTPA